MHTSIDKAGRLVIPKELRDRVGITAGPVEVQVDGSGLRIDPVATGALAEKNGRLVVGASGTTLSNEQVSQLRDALQR